MPSGLHEQAVLGWGLSMKRSIIVLSGTTVLVAAALAGCSSDSGTEASASASMVGGMTTCDDATITQAINDVVGVDDSGVAVVPPLVALECADGWAAAEATVSNGADDGGITETFIFEAEGQFWIPKDPAAVCGTLGDDMTVRPDDAQVPEGAWALACTTN